MPNKAKLTAPPIIRSFDEVFSELHLTPDERKELVFRLAAIRAQKTIEILLPETKLGFDPKMILRS